MAVKDDGFASRKFIVTMTGMGLGVSVTVGGAALSAPDGYWAVLPALFILLAAGIGAYNWANLRETQNGSAPK